MSGKNPEEQPKQKKKGDILLTLVLIVAIAVFCYAAVNLFHIYTEYKKYRHFKGDRSGRPGCRAQATDRCGFCST